MATPAEGTSDAATADIMLQPEPRNIEILPFAVAVPSSAMVDTMTFQDDYYYEDEEDIDVGNSNNDDVSRAIDELAETRVKRPIPVPRPTNANGASSAALSSGIGMVGTITVLKTSCIVWFGWGKTTTTTNSGDNNSNEAKEGEPRVGVNNSRILGSNQGSKSCSMGQFLIAMPPRKYGSSSPAGAESSTSKLIGNDYEDNDTIARQMATRLSQKYQKPVLVSCHLDPSIAQSMGADPDLIHAKAAALAEKRIWELLSSKQ